MYLFKKNITDYGVHFHYNSTHIHFGNKNLGPKELIAQYPQLKSNYLNQKHSIQIDCEPNISKTSDGYIWTASNYTAVIKTADCLPLIAVDHINHKLINLHCGRVGLVNGILKEFLNLCSSENFYSFFIGPHIQNYEIGQDLYQELKAKDINSLCVKNKSYYFSLQDFTKTFLKKNFSNYKIYETDINTLDNELYWSYRRDKETEHRNLNFAYFED